MGPRQIPVYRVLPAVPSGLREGMDAFGLPRTIPRDGLPRRRGALPAINPSLREAQP